MAPGSKPVERTSYRTALGRARGLGSAKHGVGAFIAERLTAVALIPLVVWGIWSAIVVARGGYEGAIHWLDSPVNAVLLVLTLLVGFWHMQIGLRVVIEDYVSGAAKTSLLILNLFLCILFAALSMFAVLKVAFTTGAV